MNRAILYTFIVMIASTLISCSSSEIDGGWMKLEPGHPDVVKAVSFLKKELASRHPDIRIMQVQSAKSQIVAGQHLDLICIYSSEITRKTKTLKALVFVTLDEKYSLEKLKFE